MFFNRFVIKVFLGTFLFFAPLYSSISAPDSGNGYGESCQFLGSSGGATHPEGSNCNQLLTCDPVINICLRSGEVGCIGPNVGCPIGFKCADLDSVINDNRSGGEFLAANKGARGVCVQDTGATAENNAIGDLLCNLYRTATGKVGRGIIVIVVIVTGVTFFLGKISWGTVLIIAIGSSLVFGAPTVVAIIVGKGFVC